MKNWKGKWIIISLEFSEISNDEAVQSLFIYGSGVVEGKATPKATYNLFLDPNQKLENNFQS